MHSKDELIELTHIIFPITSKKPGFGKRQEILKPINMCNRVDFLWLIGCEIDTYKVL